MLTSRPLVPLLSACLALTTSCSDEAGLRRLRAILSAAPSAIDLGDVSVGTEASAKVSVTNSGDRGATLTRVALEHDTPALEVGAWAPALSPQDTKSIGVRFVAVAAGAVEDVLLIESDADEGAILRIPIRARAFDPCVDLDGDGFGDACAPGPDCDDADPAVSPAASEACNGRDDDCDGAPDNGFGVGDRCAVSVSLPSGPCSLGGVTACAPSGAATCILDEASEACDGLDNDCNGIADDPFTDLGAACSVPEGVCQRPGQVGCAAGGASTECHADLGQPLSCCPSGQLQNPDGICCAPLPAGACRYECTADLLTGQTDCSGQVTLDEIASPMARFTVDMTGMATLEVRLESCDPTGNWLDIADSPTCNGFGGDGSSSSNDAELHLSGGSVGLFANDFVTSPATTPLFTGSIPTTGCAERVFSIADQRVQSFSPCIDVQSPYALRLNPPLDMEGTPDARWYIGLNRVVSDTSRSGTGVESATFCLR